MVLEIDNDSGHSVCIIGVRFSYDDISYDSLETFLTQHEKEQVFIIGNFNCDRTRINAMVK